VAPRSWSPKNPASPWKDAPSNPAVLWKRAPRRSTKGRTLRPSLVGAAASTSASSASVTSAPSRKSREMPSRSRRIAAARPSSSLWAKHGWSGSSWPPMQPGVPVGAAWHNGQSAHQGTTGSADTAKATPTIPEQQPKPDTPALCRDPGAAAPGLATLSGTQQASTMGRRSARSTPARPARLTPHYRRHPLAAAGGASVARREGQRADEAGRRGGLPTQRPTRVIRRGRAPRWDGDLARATDIGIAEAGGWRNLDQVRRYTRLAAIWEDPPAGRLGL
jgi:hypothetical protein